MVVLSPSSLVHNDDRPRLRFKVLIKTPLAQLLTQKGDAAPFSTGRFQLGEPIEHRKFEIGDPVAGLQREKRLRRGERHQLDSPQGMKQPRVDDDQVLVVADLNELHVAFGRRRILGPVGPLDQTDNRPPQIRMLSAERRDHAAWQGNGHHLAWPAVLWGPASPMLSRGRDG